MLILALLTAKLFITKRRKQPKCLSTDEWQNIFSMAKKQAILGITFKGVERLSKDQRPPRNLLLNWMTKPDFIAYNHKYENMLSRRLCRNLYKNTAAAWTIKSQEELEKARSQFDLFIFDSFIPDVK